MINIIDKKKCSGCSACYNICPKQCIAMDEDSNGFLYPSVDFSRCIDCHLCEKVCPFFYSSNERFPLLTYAAKNSNEKVRINSSSGGIFSSLAKRIILDGGIVYGARFDKDWNVVHASAETLEELVLFRGSKYLQSDIGKIYIDVRENLNNGRMVLFSGTSCQIAGLKKYLRRDYLNLISVEILCHGVPSPLVWKKYLKGVSASKQVVSVNFRNKDRGWTNYGYNIKIVFDDDSKYLEPSCGTYMTGLTSSLTTRPSCSVCPFKKGKSGADILLGDCWGVWDFCSHFDDNKGVSLVLLYTQKGVELFTRIDADYCGINYNDALKFNPAIEKSSSANLDSDSFFRRVKKTSKVKLLMFSYLPVKSKKDVLIHYLCKLLWLFKW